MHAPGDDTRAVIEAYTHRSHTGELSFLTFAGALTGVGVESYHVDYRRGALCCYFAGGETHTIPIAVADGTIADAFDPEAVQAAIRATQAGEIRYPEFVHRTRAAGCVGYVAWLAGRNVSYFGRRGETHVERFP